ncbi:methionyl-tRNA formyltransferase [Methylococcus geothermalis]|uniref:Methionyl-tRNA formyltransferase n=1 Tax=Methylococcus geothermalis TaxID=2681310 RepID=A0A858Q5T5_9GAMM|nr:methionyl-tRNA formyltransferase [Methylococcus geothermalis]QJD29143.1 methionyl-tRNA formyltransferase [Methylococcus geothermalis]
MNIVFAGTPAFAVPALHALIASGHSPCAVYTQPDRPAGRGRKLMASPVKQLAADYGIPVLQPESLKGPEELGRLRELAPDLMVVVAYGLILPTPILAVPRLGCVNIHASLLPRWRGAAPIQRAILAGDPETGVTLMRIEPRLDAGPMLAKRNCPIAGDDTAATLHDRLAGLGAEMLIELLPELEAGGLPGETQDEALVTYAEKIEKSEARIDWRQNAAQIDRRVRAFNPWPVAETTLEGTVLRIWAAQALDTPLDAAPGTAVAASKNFDVACGQGTLRILEIQPPGKRRMSAADFLNAHPIDGKRLGT